jgi:predicted ArsR family transcriptional regulator
MQTTREQVFAFVLERHGVRVEEVAEALDLSPAGARRHLDYLRGEGLLDVRMVRQHSGRPYYEFVPSRKALERGGAAYSRLVERLIAHVSSLSPTDVAGRDGADIIGEALERAAEDVALEHKGEVASQSVDGKVRQVTDSLKAEGILDGFARKADGYHLYNSSCPYLRAAELTRAPCASDRRTIELLINEEIIQLGTIVDGHNCCEYLVKSAATPLAKE